jgi:hypothetical protein
MGRCDAFSDRHNGKRARKHETLEKTLFRVFRYFRLFRSFSSPLNSNQSALRATIGSTRVARRAGR